MSTSGLLGLLVVLSAAAACTAILLAYAVAYHLGKKSGYQRGWKDCLRANGTNNY